MNLKKSTIIVLIILCWLFNILLLFCQITPINNIDQKNQVKSYQEPLDLKISENRSNPNEIYRQYQLGVTINTKNLNASTEAKVEAAEECGRLGEQNLVVIDDHWYNLPERVYSPQIGWGVCDYLIEIIGGMKPILQTNFWNVSNTPPYGLRPNLVIPTWLPSDTLINDTVFINEWSEHCVNLTQEQEQDFFILSKEVNDFWSPVYAGDNYDAVNNTFEDFLLLMKNSTQEIHKVAPNTKTIIEFRMPTLNALKQWDLVAQVNSSHCDIIGFTTYPYLLNDSSGLQGTLYPTPQNLPDNYYAKILNYTDMPIAFTEIGWSTSNMTDANRDFTGTNETEQEDFVDIFFEQIDKIPQVELVNWLYLHDTENRTEETHPVELIGIKHLNGTKKLSYDNWDLISNRSYLIESEVIFEYDWTKFKSEMTSDYKMLNITIGVQKSHAAMEWTVNATSLQSGITFNLSTHTKLNITSFLINETILPEGSYSLKIIGTIDNIHINWTRETPINTEPSDLLLTSNAIPPDTDGIFDLSWTKSIFADNYSVYWSNHSISDSNINATNDVYLLYNGIARLFNINKWINGTFFFKVFAINEYGNATSEVIVIVDLKMDNGGEVNDDDDDDDSGKTPTILGYNYIIVLSILFIGCILFSTKRLRK